MKIRRRWFVILAVLAIAGTGAFFFLRSYIAGEMAAQVAEFYGGPVEVDSATIDFGGASLRGLRFLEMGPEKRTWLSVPRLNADLTLWDLLAGRRMPRELTLHEPEVVLRLDERGKLLTQLPPAPSTTGRLPETVRLVGGRLTIEQQGRDPMTVAGLAGDAQIAQQRAALKAAVVDDKWGQWRMQGEVDLANWNSQVELTSTRFEVDPALVKTIPLVGREISEQVQVAGPTEIAAKARYESKRHEFHYQAAAVGHKLDVYLPALDLKITHVAGRATIEDGKGQLQQLSGDVAQGRVQVGGAFHLKSDGVQLDPNISAQGLALSELPRSWELPSEIEGRFSGDAELKIDVARSRIHVSGTGKGEISDAQIAGLPAEPIHVELQPAGKMEEKPARGEGLQASGQLTFRLVMKDVEAVEALDRVARLGEDMKALPKIPLRGLVSAEVDVAIPLSSPRDPRTYGAQGAVTSPALAMDDWLLGDLRATLNYREGNLLVEPLQATLSASDAPSVPPAEAGKLRGRLQAAILPAGELQLEGTLSRVPLGPLFKAAGVNGAGQLSAHIQAKVQVAKVTQLAAWELQGDLAGSAIVEGRKVEHISARCHTEDGSLTIQDISATLAGNSLTGEGHVKLREPYEFQAQLIAPQANVASTLLAAGIKTDLNIDGNYRAAASVEGTVAPLDWKAAGDVSMPRAQVERVAIRNTGLHWSADSRAMELDFKSQALGTEWTVRGTLGLASDAVTQITGGFQKITLENLARELKLPPRVVAGSARGEFAIGQPKRGAPLVVELKWQGSDLRVRNVPVERVAGRAEYHEGKLEYSLEGHALDGQIHVQGQLPLAALQQTNAPRGEGRIEIHGLQLSRAWLSIGQQNRLKDLEGVANFSLDYHHRGLDFSPVGRGRLTLDDLRYQRNLLTERLEATVLVDASTLRLADLRARVDDGTLGGDVLLNLRQFERSSFTLRLDRVSAPWLLRPWPELGRDMEGPVNVVLRGTLGRTWRGSGILEFPYGRLRGIDVSGARVPLDWMLSPERGFWRIEIPETSLSLARGRAVGRATLDWDLGLNLDGQIRFSNLDLHSITHSAGGLGQFASGRVSGRVQFAGQNVRSIDDLTGTFNASIAQAQAMQFPVLRELARFVIPGQPTTVTFQQGTLRGRLARGIVEVQQLTLNGPNSLVLIAGTVTTRGRLALNVTAEPSRSTLQPIVQRYLSISVLAAAPLSLPLLARANAILSSRLIFLRVTGTVRSPTIQVRAAEQLGQEVALYFLAPTTGVLALPRSK